MLIQVILLYFMMAVAGAVFCLYAMTDANEVSTTRRQNYFPVGLGLLPIPFGSILCAWESASTGAILDSYLGIHAISVLAGLAGLVHGAIGGAVTGLGLGLWHNSRLKLTMPGCSGVPDSNNLRTPLLARYYKKCFGPH